jgi:hypothetical protein
LIRVQIYVVDGVAVAIVSQADMAAMKDVAKAALGDL